MRRLVMALVMAVLVAMVTSAHPLALQKQKGSAKKAPTKTEPLKSITPETKCQSLIGMGVKTVRAYCDILAGRDPADGVILSLPAHTGAGTLMFDLHARHTYSEDEMQRGKPYAHYRAGIGILTMKGELLGRGAVDAEFRTEADLFDRITGGAGPGGLKAVAPAGREPIFIEIPANVDQVSLLGESLDATTAAGHETVVMPGRPVAIVSNILFEYHPAPTKPTKQ